MLTHVEKDIKDFIHLKECKRKGLLQHFDDTAAYVPVVPHLCCDNCAQLCKCESTDCGLQTRYPSTQEHIKQPVILRERAVTESQKQKLEENLFAYHKSLVG